MMEHKTKPTVDWPTFLERCDLRWDDGVGDTWGECAFIADGWTGASIYGMPGDSDVLRWELGRTDVTAHYRLPEDWCVPRVPIGNVLLRLSQPVKERNMRLRLWDGEATGEMRSAAGLLRWTSFIERETDVLVVELEEDTDGIARINFQPEWSISARALDCGVDFDALPAAQKPPQPYRDDDEDIHVAVQPLTEHGAHATAWAVTKIAPGRRVLYLAVRSAFSLERPRKDDARAARAEAVAAVRAAREIGSEVLRNRHREWWHTYLKQSWVSLPHDPRWEQFYWVQIYKFGCASRADVPIIIDNLGPWYTRCGWAGTWWNLNVQLSYFPTFSANRLDAGRSLITAMDHYFRTGSMRVPGHPEAITIDRTSSYDASGGVTYEIGNLTWCLHNYWRYWKFSMDDAIGRRLFPLLKADVNYCLMVLAERDGRLHIPPSVSPEYPGGPFENTGYAHQLLRWALCALLELNERFKLEDPLASCWEDTLERLADLPVGEHGLMVAARQGYDMSHRHWSHLLALYPLHTINPDQGPEAEALFRKSLARWCSFSERWRGYSFLGTAAMFSVLGEGDRALQEMCQFLEEPTVQANTMYVEDGGPVIETPMSAVEAVNYMLLQSWGDVIRVFPAMPTAWPDAEFQNLRTEGAFLVSAQWSNGRTAWIEIHSLAGESCIVEAERDDLAVSGKRKLTARALSGPNGRCRFEIDLREGETAWLQATEETTHAQQ